MTNLNEHTGEVTIDSAGIMCKTMVPTMGLRYVVREISEDIPEHPGFARVRLEKVLQQHFGPHGWIDVPVVQESEG